MRVKKQKYKLLHTTYYNVTQVFSKSNLTPGWREVFYFTFTSLVLLQVQKSTLYTPNSDVTVYWHTLEYTSTSLR